MQPEPEINIQELINRYNTVIGEQVGRIIFLESQVRALSEELAKASTPEKPKDKEV